MEILCRIGSERGDVIVDGLLDVVHRASFDLNGIKGNMRRTKYFQELGRRGGVQMIVMTERAREEHFE